MITPQFESVINNAKLKIKQVGMIDYLVAWQAMKDFTNLRTNNIHDEIWLVQHPPVYTLGIAGNPKHLLHQNGIEIIKTDRGGQITYHGPGQLVAYLLLDIRRLKIGVRELVRKMENAVIDLLKDYHVAAASRLDAPGVYVANAKIAALGLKIKRGFCYHGIALNIDMDLRPFYAINPCGYPGLKVTQTKDLGITDGLEILSDKLTEKLKISIFNNRSV
jgi:lipoyl(octanoyl) transferase